MALLSRVRLAFWNSVRSCCISGAPAAGTCNRLRVAICSKGRTSLHLHRQSYCSLPVSCRPGAYAERSRARCPTATWRKSDSDVSHWIFLRFLILQTEPANSLHGYAGHSMLGKLNPVGTARWPDHWRTVAALGWLEALRASNQGVWAPGRSLQNALWLWDACPPRFCESCRTCQAWPTRSPHTAEASCKSNCLLFNAYFRETVTGSVAPSFWPVLD